MVVRTEGWSNLIFVPGEVRIRSLCSRTAVPKVVPTVGPYNNDPNRESSISRHIFKFYLNVSLDHRKMDYTETLLF